MSKPFEAITWGQYLGVAFAVLAIYYLYVAAAYYRFEVAAMLKGKGKVKAAAEPAVAVASRPSLLGATGPLIGDAVLAMQAPADDDQAVEEEQSEAIGEEEEEESIEEVKIEESKTDNINNLNRNDDADELPGPEVADSDEDFTVGVAQLSDYFEDAAAGNITQEELVAQMPELENTDLLVAFFQSNLKAAQQLTSQIYVDVPEPVLD